MYSVMVYEKDYLHTSLDISFDIMFYIINTMKINIRQFDNTFVLKITKKVPIWTWSPSPLFVHYQSTSLCILELWLIPNARILLLELTNACNFFYLYLHSSLHQVYS